MTESMTQDRFRALAEAYGASIGRWPEQVRGSAAMVVTERWADAALRGADELDDALDHWTLPPADQALAVRIAASAPIKRQSALRNARLWWTGLGFAAAVAGIATGSVAAAAFEPVHVVSEPATAFGDLGQEQQP